MTEHHYVELPGGGAEIPLLNQQEVDRWQTLQTQYMEQYDLRKVNDLTNLGTLLVQHINLLRAQLGLSGITSVVDDDGLPTGEMHRKVLKPAETKAFQTAILDAQKEIREIERNMGIDKKSREQAGDEGVRAWLLNMKDRAYRYGLHINKRTQAYEEFAMELRWRVRLNLYTGDGEDKHYEDCTDEGVIKWIDVELAKLEQIDRDFAHEERALVLGVRQ